uniref:Uncharacterized protein n=1 Tax=Oryza brachyantha TaxID=4533 RepID=J3LAT3_ORYBR
MRREGGGLGRARRLASEATVESTAVGGRSADTATSGVNGAVNNVARLQIRRPDDDGNRWLSIGTPLDGVFIVNVGNILKVIMSNSKQVYKRGAQGVGVPQHGAHFGGGVQPAMLG